MLSSKSKYSLGFTLIELLVVISIISLLSSIVYSSVRNARIKAKDTTVISQMQQLQILYESVYVEKGNYHDFSSVSYIKRDITCDEIMPSLYEPYKSKIRNICKVIYDNTTDGLVSVGSEGNFHIIAAPQIPYNNTELYYSWVAYLNDGSIYCVGNSGRGRYADANLNNKGCLYNP